MFSAFKKIFSKSKNFPSNVLITAPHGSSKIPVRIFPHLTRDYQLSPRLLLNFSDYGTKYLIEDVPNNQKVVAKYGRIIGDPNRSRDAEDLIRFYDFGKIPIFREKFQKRLEASWFKSFWMKKLLSYSYDPFWVSEIFKSGAVLSSTSGILYPFLMVSYRHEAPRILFPVS